MKNLKVIAIIYAIISASSLHAQTLSLNNKTVKVEEFPEYIIINSDNISSILGQSIRIVIQAKNSEFEKSLKDLQDLLEDNKYLKISNQTDLLNAMSKLGFDYVDAFPQNPSTESSFSRTGFVFRKKEKYRS
jgi:predicted RND superfamily exporter protein